MAEYRREGDSIVITDKGVSVTVPVAEVEVEAKRGDLSSLRAALVGAAAGSDQVAIVTASTKLVHALEADRLLGVR